MASLKTFYRGKEPVAQFFNWMPWYFSVGFRWSVGRLKGRSDEPRPLPCLHLGADNRTDNLRTDPPTDRPFNGLNGFRSDTHFLIMNHSNEMNLKIICSIRQNQIRIMVFLRWVRLGLRTMGTERCSLSRLGGRALQLEQARGRALRLEQDRGPSAAARVG